MNRRIIPRSQYTLAPARGAKSPREVKLQSNHVYVTLYQVFLCFKRCMYSYLNISTFRSLVTIKSTPGHQTLSMHVHPEPF